MAMQLCSAGGASQSKVRDHIREATAYSSWPVVYKAPHAEREVARDYFGHCMSGVQVGTGTPPSAKTGVEAQVVKRVMINKTRRMVRFIVILPSPEDPGS